MNAGHFPAPTRLVVLLESSKETSDSNKKKYAIALGALATVGAIGGGLALRRYLKNKKNAMPPGTWSANAQALDNVGIDPWMISGEDATDLELRQRYASKVGDTAEHGKDLRTEYYKKLSDTSRNGKRSHNKLIDFLDVTKHGYNILVHIPTDQRDVANRVAGMIYHGNVKDGLDETVSRIRKFYLSAGRTISDDVMDEAIKMMRKAGMK